MTELGQTATGLGNAQSPAEAPLLHGVLAASFATWAHEFEEDRSTNQLIPGVTLQWEPDDNTNLYIAYAEGFKSGGFNSVDDQNPDFVRTEAGLLDTTSLSETCLALVSNTMMRTRHLGKLVVSIA